MAKAYRSRRLALEARECVHTANHFQIEHLEHDRNVPLDIAGLHQRLGIVLAQHLDYSEAIADLLLQKT